MRDVNGAPIFGKTFLRAIGSSARRTSVETKIEPVRTPREVLTTVSDDFIIVYVTATTAIVQRAFNTSHCTKTRVRSFARLHGMYDDSAIITGSQYAVRPNTGRIVAVHKLSSPVSRSRAKRLAEVCLMISLSFKKSIFSKK